MNNNANNGRRRFVPMSMVTYGPDYRLAGQQQVQQQNQTETAHGSPRAPPFIPQDRDDHIMAAHGPGYQLAGPQQHNQTAAVNNPTSFAPANTAGQGSASDYQLGDPQQQNQAAGVNTPTLFAPWHVAVHGFTSNHQVGDPQQTWNQAATINAPAPFASPSRVAYGYNHALGRQQQQYQAAATTSTSFAPTNMAAHRPNHQLGGQRQVNPAAPAANVPRPFRAMDMVVHGPNHRQVQRVQNQLAPAPGPASGLSPNYNGDPRNMRNHSANIPDEENCAFWITDLPSGVTPKDILGSIKQVGRVFALHINEPNRSSNPNNRRHLLPAAKLVFFKKLAATIFYERHVKFQRPLYVKHQPAKVVRNRIRVPDQKGLPSNHSRVLFITGPPEFVNIPYLTAFFKDKFTYMIDDIIWHGQHPKINMLEWRFSSYRCQANMAYKALTQDPVLGEKLRVVYDEDPCDLLADVGWDRDERLPDCHGYGMFFSLEDLD
ncbi:hypothetical protein B0H66DRAFT_613306 [Apodospora peruviana]|uniref:Uncharacterized protein n=1 Tax=Apodospora peruviana TaxID=516989 RepID=A0AAE0IUH1_9PEZI|nr:hypothetical protein B0H66DRAFT_613306 [Apodospora peruviana]